MFSVRTIEVISSKSELVILKNIPETTELNNQISLIIVFSKEQITAKIDTMQTMLRF